MRASPAGLGVLHSPVSLVVGGFDPLMLLGSLMVAWAAYLAWAGSFSLEGWLLWTVTIAACGATALGVEHPDTDRDPPQRRQKAGRARLPDHPASRRRHPNWL